MPFERLIQFLTWVGGLVFSLVQLPAAWAPLQHQLPLWAFGLAAIIVVLLIFKIITHVVFKVLMWAALVVAVLIFASSLGAPIAQWLAGF